ncbi:hypothetical protein RCL1_006692 [Eukaryota sp. TZLM3-RCL]
MSHVQFNYLYNAAELWLSKLRTCDQHDALLQWTSFKDWLNNALNRISEYEKSENVHESLLTKEIESFPLSPLENHNEYRPQRLSSDDNITYNWTQSRI